MIAIIFDIIRFMSIMDMQVPFNDTSRIFSTNREQLLNRIEAVAESGRWLLGNYTRQFSQAFAVYCGTEYCLPVANGTDALELALRAVLPEPNIGDTSEVVTVANAGGYSTTACRLVGAVPVYADIEMTNQLMCPHSLANCLGPKVKAVILTHLYGGVINVEQIRHVLKEKDYEHVIIIEDCAQAHGGVLSGQRVGSLGDIATFSFYPTKNLGAMGDAGAVLTSDVDLYEKIQVLHQYGWQSKYRVQVPYGRNSRMDEMQAAVLDCLLPLLEEFNNKRKDVYLKYREASGDKLQFLNHDGGDYVAHLAVVMSPERDAFVKYMKNKGIGVDIHYPLLDCDQPGWESLPMRMDMRSNLNVSKRSVTQVVSLPCFPTLHEHQIMLVCQALREWERL